MFARDRKDHDGGLAHRALLLACGLAACVMQAACSEARVSGNFHLATVTASPRHGLVFVAQPGFDAVDVLRIVDETTRNDAPAFVARLRDPGRSHVLRLAVDHKHARLWVADFWLVQVYDLPTLKELRRYELDRKASYYDRFSDLAIDNAGNAFVLARGGARVYRIDAASLDLEHWLDLDDQASDAALLLANRLLKSRDDRYLFLASASSGALLRIDMQNRQVLAVAGNSPNFSCGVLLWGDVSDHMHAFECTGRWEAQIEVASQSPDLVVPRGQRRPSGAIVRFAP